MVTLASGAIVTCNYAQASAVKLEGNVGVGLTFTLLLETTLIEVKGDIQYHLHIVTQFQK